jgi:hypothetical protein
MATSGSFTPAVSVLVVNYNTAALTKSCVASLRAQAVRDHMSGAEGVEVIVIDNASRPDERRAFDGLDAILILNDKNRGYGAALNQALTRATGEFLLFSNSDTWYFPGALQKLLDGFQRLPCCGAVGPRLWWDREREFLLPPSDPVTPFSFLLAAVVRHRRTLANYRADRWRRRALDYWQARTPLEQPLLSGACLLTHRAVINTCGGFDERFHLYYEDTDWCRQVRRKGYRLYYIPEAEVAHLYNQSAGQTTNAAQRAGNASLEYYFRKHYGRLCWRLLTLANMNRGSAKRQAEVSADYNDLGALQEPPTFSLPLNIVRNNYAASGDCHSVPSSPLTGEDKGGGESPHTRTSTPHPDLPPQGGKEPTSEPGKPAAYFVRSVLRDDGPYLLQLSPQADCLPAIARFCSTTSLSLSPSVWAQLAEGEFFAQLFSLPHLQLKGRWRWRKANVAAI